MTTIYLDESGHSGDMINSGDRYDFNGQPYFVLAAVALEPDHDWARRIKELRTIHRVDEKVELKSAKLVNKPKFCADVICALLKQGVPIFIEVMHKKYFICTNIASFHLLPSHIYANAEGPDLMGFRRAAAAYLCARAPDSVIDAFVAACREPGDERLRASFGALRGMAHREDLAFGSAFDMAAAFAQARYEQARRQDEQAWRSFLPMPDLNRFAKHVWMSPNLGAFTHLYARVNFQRKGRLAGVRLRHDEQLEVEPLLREAKTFVESLHADGVFLPPTPLADFYFKEQASLEFAQSHDEIGLQIADLLAGVVMRFYRHAEDPEWLRTAPPRLKEAIKKLMDPQLVKMGGGIHHVAPPRVSIWRSAYPGWLNPLGFVFDSITRR